MDYKCDLYVYESSNGVEIHFAGSRRDVPEEDYPPLMDDPPENASEEEFKAYWTKWFERHQMVMDLIKDKPLVPIGGPLDGETRTFSDHDDAADWIEGFLAPLGIYIYPDDLAASLRADRETADVS